MFGSSHSASSARYSISKNILPLWTSTFDRKFCLLRDKWEQKRPQIIFELTGHFAKFVLVGRLGSLYQWNVAAVKNFKQQWQQPLEGPFVFDFINFSKATSGLCDKRPAEAHHGTAVFYNSCKHVRNFYPLA